ncbi:MAG: ferric reductase-like transmembrane domain-containing protein [Candidatus Marinimicrobia bacterium]|nr:ferric reductase-like transmembrane domain-containing protein [Candidatus Neomarinimicrobiota bacterium]
MNRNSATLIISTIIFSLVYAIIRYHYFKELDFSLFIFVINKGVSLGSVLLLSFSYTVGPLARNFPKVFMKFTSGKRLFGITGFGLAFLHSIISLLIFEPEYFNRFFILEELNIVGNFILITGIISLILIGAAFITSFPRVFKFKPSFFSLSQRAGLIGLIFGGIHVLPIGINGWAQPNLWPGYLIPITLISFIVVIFTIYCRTVLNSRNQNVD